MTNDFRKCHLRINFLDGIVVERIVTTELNEVIRIITRGFEYNKIIILNEIPFTVNKAIHVSGHGSSDDPYIWDMEITEKPSLKDFNPDT